MSSTTPEITGLHHNDAALDPSHQHHHSHLHHSDGVITPDNEPAYTRDTTNFEKPLVPIQSNPSSPIREHAAGEKQLGGMDEEKAHSDLTPESDPEDYDDQGKKKYFKIYYRKFRPAVHALVFCLFTGWWIASLILHRNDKNWIIPFLFWLAIAVRIITFYIPIRLIVLNPAKFVWTHTALRVLEFIPEKFRTISGAALVFVVYILGTFISEEVGDNTRANRAVSLFGLAVMIFVLYITSNNRKAIQWHTVIVGMLIQFLIGLFVLRSQAGYDIFDFISSLCRSLLGFALDGVLFLTAGSQDVAKSVWFLVTVLPAIIFFIALVQMLYYWGIIQWFVLKFAKFFFWSMRVSGAEAVVAAASPFIGQGESAMLIRPFIPHLTKAEIHQVMCSGFATIAGSVLVAYIGLGVSPQALISSCVMSIPASLAVSKLRYPETEESLTAGTVSIPDDDEHRSANTLHAFANGAWLGLKIAGMIASSLLCIVALIALANGLLTWWGKYLNINDPPLTIELVVGYLCYPIAFLLGVPRKGNDLYMVGKLIGVKIIQNEFVAYSMLQSAEYAVISDRARLISTYALCGFANLGSLGIQIGVLSQLSPSRSGDVSRIALSALLAGAISTLTSACVAGLLIVDPAAYLPVFEIPSS